MKSSSIDMKSSSIDQSRGDAPLEAQLAAPPRAVTEPDAALGGNPQAASGYAAHEGYGAPRLISVRSDVERFCVWLTQDISKFAMQHAKLEGDHGQLTQRHASLDKDHARAKEALAAAEAHTAALQVEQTRLRKEMSVLAAKLDAAKSEAQAALDGNTQLRARNQALEAEKLALDAECDRRGVSLAELRQKLTDMSQNAEMARMQVEQGRERENELAAGKIALEAENKGMRSEIEGMLHRAAQDHKKIGRFVAVMETARGELEMRSRQIQDCEEGKAKLAAERDALFAELDENRQASRQRQDALAETRDSLLEMSERQRKQIEEQMARMAQLEAANARLGQELLTASAQTSSPGAQPCENIPLAAPGTIRKNQVNA